MNSNRIRLLVTLVLAATIVSVTVGDALASRWLPATTTTSTVTLGSSGISRPSARTANGEPDGGQTITTPVVSYHGITPTGGSKSGYGAPSTSGWIQWIWAYWFTRVLR